MTSNTLTRLLKWFPGPTAKYWDPKKGPESVFCSENIRLVMNSHPRPQWGWRGAEQPPQNSETPALTAQREDPRVVLLCMVFSAYPELPSSRARNTMHTPKDTVRHMQRHCGASWRRCSYTRTKLPLGLAHEIDYWRISQPTGRASAIRP